MPTTPYPDVDRLLESLLARLRGVLGERLVGLYLYGSLTTGDFDPGVSDLDLLAAIASHLSDAEFAALRDMHTELERDNPAWHDRIDVSYLSLEALRTFRSRASPMAVITPGERFKTIHAGADWLVNWYQVRENGVTLFGPPPEQLIDPISPDEFAACVRGYVAEWGRRIQNIREPRFQAYAVLTMCRALHLYRTGEPAAKRAAAAWACRQLPDWSALVRDSLALREAPPDAPPPHPNFHAEAIRFVAFTNAEVAAGP